MYTGELKALDPLAYPLLAEPLAFAHHPRTHIVACGCDALRGQDQAYAELLRQSGVPTTEEFLPGVPHQFTLSNKAKVVMGFLEREVRRFADAFGL